MSDFQDVYPRFAMLLRHWCTRSLRRCANGLVAALALVAGLGGAGDTTLAQSAPPRTMIVFDGSGSMWGRLDGGKSAKFEMAIEALRRSLPGLPAGLQTGVAGFGSGTRGCAQASILAPPAAHDSGRLLDALKGWNPRGKGPLVAALQAAAASVDARDATGSSLILIYDGPDNCQADPCAAATAIKAAHPGLKIHLVGLGLKPQEAAQMACLASISGGRVFNVDSAGELDAAIERAIREVASLAPAVKVLPSAARDKPPAAPAIGTPGFVSALKGPGLSVHLTAGRADGERLAVSSPIYWRLFAGSKVPEDSGSLSGGGKPVAPIAAVRASHLLVHPPAGTYTVEAVAGGLTVHKSFELAAGESKQLALSADAGLLDVAVTIGGKLDGTSGAIVAVESKGASNSAGLLLNATELPVPLAPGQYMVRARQGLLASHVSSVEVKSGKRSTARFSMDGGRLRFAVRAGKGSAPINLGQLRVLLHVDSPDGRGGRQEVLRTGSPAGDWVLPAGTYYASVTSGAVSVSEPIVVAPGEVTDRTIELAGRRIKLSLGGIEQLGLRDQDVVWRISRLDGARGFDLSLSGSHSDVILGDGRYLVKSRIGQLNVEHEVDVFVSASSKESMAIAAEAGRLVLRLGEGAARRGVRWELSDESRKPVWSSSDLAPDIILRPGSYHLRVQLGSKFVERKVSVLANNRQTLEIPAP